MSSLFDLGGRVALITEGTTQLGRHLALTLARAGAKVALGACKPEDVQATLAAIEAFDGRAISIRIDVDQPDSIAAGVDAAETELGTLNILVNNAGFAVARPLLETHRRAALLAIQAASRRMAAHGHGGAIVNILPPSEPGLLPMTKAAALELAGDGIRVNALALGYIEADLEEGFLASEAGQAALRRIPLRRLGGTADLDGPLLLLVSEASRYMTGAVIAVDGGHGAALE